MRKYRSFSQAAAVALAGSLAIPALAPGRVMLQYFEGRWETIDRRMPDIFMSGYGALWLPPGARADSGDQSVGFDVFDRFDLGQEGRPTLYGTESGLRQLVQSARRAGIFVYFDTVYNHNGFSDGQRGNRAGENCSLRWGIGDGGYPGFVMSGRDLGLPFDLEFRNVCGGAPSCDSNAEFCRIAGLIDINHDTNYRWIRHPITQGDPRNIPYQDYRITPDNRRFYPDLDLPAYPDGPHPFNLQNPMAGDPVEENVNMMLQRYTQWMLESVGVDGFRLDAVKHTSDGWYNNVYDFAAFQRGRDFWGRRTTPFSFGEMVDGSWDNLRRYHRRDGYGNRTVLDFPLKFAFNNNLGNPSASLQAILGASADGIDDGNPLNGTAAVQFVQSHDTGFIGDPPNLQNVAYAFIMARKGYPVVYYNPREFLPTLGQRDFPNNNTRGDALGLYGGLVERLVKINANFVAARGGNDHRSLWQDNDVVAYELNNTLVVGLCDRDDNGGGTGYVERSVTNFGFRGVTLVEVTGNAADPVVDPNNQIPDTLTIPAQGPVTLRIPTARNANGVSHGRPYVMYSLQTPQGRNHGNAARDIGLRLLNASSTLAADPVSVNEAVRRLTPIDVVTQNVAQIELQVDLQSGPAEDNALIKWNHGLNIDGSNEGDFGIAFGVDSPLLAGYENYTERSVSANGGTGTYRINVNLADPNIPEGYNYITSIAFLPRLQGLPPVFNTFRKVIYVDRRGPDTTLVFPATQTGINDIPTSSYGFVVDNPDGTGNSMHYFWNLPQGTNPVTGGLLNDSNRATRTDRKRWRFDIGNLTTSQNNRLTVVLFEQTGNYSIANYTLGVQLPQQTPTPSPTPATPTPTPSNSASPTLTATPSASPTQTPIITATQTPVPTTPVPTPTPLPTDAPTPTASPSPSLDARGSGYLIY